MGEFKRRIMKVLAEYDVRHVLGDLLTVVEEFKKEFLAVDTEKAIHEEYWEIFEKWFGENK